MTNQEEHKEACIICGHINGHHLNDCLEATPTPPQETGKAGEGRNWESDFDLVIAQSAPFSIIELYKDGNFRKIKSFVREILAQERALAYQQGRADMAGEVREADIKK